MNKLALFVSIGLTVFLMMAAGGIVYSMRTTGQAAAADSSPTQTVNEADIQKIIIDREATYQDLLAQANARLAQAQKQIQALQAQLDALQASGQQSVPPSALTVDQVAEIASKYLGQTDIYTIEAVTIRGFPFYQVTFSSGDIVYVTPDGQIAGSVSAQQNGSRGGRIIGGGGHDEHDEHESGEDD